jgi:hypothetical protein
MGKMPGSNGKCRIHKGGVELEGRLYGLIGHRIFCRGGNQGVFSQDVLKRVLEKTVLRTVVVTEISL